MIDNTIFFILILLSGASFAFLMGLPFSIAFFYEKTFEKRAFPYLFIISGILFMAYFFFFPFDIFSDVSSMFFAAGGISLAVASLRLYLVMTGGG